jgi:hypothetical protein
MRASNQWATRPDDERFWTIADLLTATEAYRAAARQSEKMQTNDLRVEVVDGALRLAGKTGATAGLTHWAFGQLSARADAPASYLRQLPATLAAQNLNYGLKAAPTERDARLLLHSNGGYFCRAVTSDKYTRIWNNDVVRRLLPLEADGWKVPPAYAKFGGNGPETEAALTADRVRRATAEQAALSLSIGEGDLIQPSGLYASSEDMFAFMVHPEKVIRDGSPEGLMRGFFVWNSEVGKATFGIQTFYFRGVCGNHIVWSAQDVKVLKLRHVGNADERAFDGLSVELTKYANESATDIEAKIAMARTFVLKDKSKAEVIDFVFASKFLTRKDAEAAYDAVIPEQDGAPYTAWGFAQGVTRVSQTRTNADERVALDRAAGRIIEVAF